MVHVEDSEAPWAGNDSGGAAWGNDDTAVRVASLAAAVGAEGAKISLQLPYRYLAEGNYPMTLNVTSLRVVLENGGNFWVHTHSATFDHLQSAYTVVKSVYANEWSSATPEDHVRGRSGGWSFELDGAAPYDWVSITAHAGLRVMNSAVMMAHARVPTSMRPYGYTDDEIRLLHHHDAAPGPLDPEIGTMRIRPFWMNTASTWFEFLNTIYPSTQGVNVANVVVPIGSVMMIPQPSRTELKGKAEGRSAYTVKTLTPADLTYALTEIWSVHQLGETHQNSISRVWYTHINPSVIDENTIPMLTSWVADINAAMAGKAVWANMNEIADLFSHTESFWY